MNKKTIITRQEAIDVITELAETEFFGEMICQKLADIAHCIDAEFRGYHLWGGGDDSAELFIARRDDLWTDEVVERVGKIAEKYTFKPAPHEEDELKEWLEDNML